MQAAAPKIGFIGTGNMGRPLIERLLNAGYEVQVYDIDPTHARPIIDLGAHWKATPALCASNCQIVVTCLPLPHHVLETMTGPDGALAGMTVNTVWIDTSTTDYHNTRHIAALARRKKIFSLEAPVSNLSHMGVDFANVCFYIGGDEGGYRLSQVMLETMGRKSFYVGEIGAGQSVKLLTNLLFYAATAVWAELLVLARANDIPLHWLWDFVKVSRGNCFVSNQLTPFMLDASYDHSCTLEITVKDMNLTEALADELGIAMPLGRIIAQRYRQAGALFDTQDNHVKVAALSERENDIRLALPDFQAPSPYGANRNYRHNGAFVEDTLGRITPVLPETFHSGITFTDNNKIKLASHLVEFLACVNKIILDEASEIGTAMGLSASLVEQVVNWSCGPSWVAEHLDTYEPCYDSIAAVGEQLQALRLTVIEQIFRHSILGSPFPPRDVGHTLHKGAITQ
ncbi:MULTISPECIES: NAD(P)-dependent oxidoreductase [Pseudomonas]|uniref:NAD(P)-dependent oxidoreductase n=1 Tax=Pseudomonas TaxID=286 RepID=UPI000B35BE43|nr:MULTISPECIES: NAD(P)-dependent oxidoreductase [Pseudomonas]PMY64055.1 2-hydroxy-3-oxopropionate reductase [Pseudomonas sp. FW305-25]PMY68006.1 2-hydroxy-3-oxopropionate reductase [Pseudomonas sp. FW126-L8]PNA79354.1 2-hydroxy-3-oxopropionate reductase [Pseudomonas sp. FW305-76]